MIIQPLNLESLAFHWADAYVICYARDRWVALRRDTRQPLTAGTLAGLETAIEADYRHHPVPRAFDPPGTGYLENDEPADQDTQFILAALRQAFPLWTITYSGQLRAWVARTRNKNICQNSPVLLCTALVLIERQHRQVTGW